MTAYILNMVVHIFILQTKQKIYGKNFQYTVLIAVNYREIELHPERFSNIESFINKYNWKRINYP